MHYDAHYMGIKRGYCASTIAAMLNLMQLNNVHDNMHLKQLISPDTSLVEAIYNLSVQHLAYERLNRL